MRLERKVMDQNCLLLDVMMKTPPSGLALKVERAAFIRCVCAFTLIAKHVSQSSAVGA